MVEEERDVDFRGTRKAVRVLERVNNGAKGCHNYSRMHYVYDLVLRIRILILSSIFLMFVYSHQNQPKTSMDVNRRIRALAVESQLTILLWPTGRDCDVQWLFSLFFFYFPSLRPEKTD